MRYTNRRLLTEFTLNFLTMLTMHAVNVVVGPRL